MISICILTVYNRHNSDVDVQHGCYRVLVDGCRSTDSKFEKLILKSPSYTESIMGYDALPWRFDSLASYIYCRLLVVTTLWKVKLTSNMEY